MKNNPMNKYIDIVKGEYGKEYHLKNSNLKIDKQQYKILEVKHNDLYWKTTAYHVPIRRQKVLKGVIKHFNNTFERKRWYGSKIIKFALFEKHKEGQVLIDNEGSYYFISKDKEWVTKMTLTYLTSLNEQYKEYLEELTKKFNYNVISKEDRKDIKVKPLY